MHCHIKSLSGRLAGDKTLHRFTQHCGAARCGANRPVSGLHRMLPTVIYHSIYDPCSVALQKLMLLWVYDDIDYCIYSTATVWRDAVPTGSSHGTPGFRESQRWYITRYPMAPNLKWVSISYIFTQEKLNRFVWLNTFDIVQPIAHRTYID